MDLSICQISSNYILKSADDDFELIDQLFFIPITQ